MEEVEKHIEKKEKNYWKFFQTIFWIGLCIYGGLYLLSLQDMSFIKGEIGAYGIQCETKPVNNTCSRPSFAMRAVYYKPDKDRQEVVSWTEGFPPDRLTNCAVVDRKNWKCEFDDKSATFGFQDGSYFNYPTDKTFDTVYYVDRATWVKKDCKGSIYKSLYCIPFHDRLRKG